MEILWNTIAIELPEHYFAIINNEMAVVFIENNYNSKFS